MLKAGIENFNTTEHLTDYCEERKYKVDQSVDKKVGSIKQTDSSVRAANDRELATREILQSISDNRDDEAPVFEVILENACRLCNAPLACLFLVNPERTHLTVPASYGTRSQFVDLINNDPPPLDPEQSISARAMVEKCPLQIADLSDNAVYRSSQPHRVNAIEIEGIRSCLTVPLMVGDEAIGAIFLYRREVSPFSENEVELVETFAAQAVIAIENVKQFRELQAKLEREAATSEILRVISLSRDDDQPVFDVILERASILCEAPSAGLLLGCMDDKILTYAGNAGINTKIGDALKSATLPMDPNASYSARSILEGKLFQFDDMAESELYKSGSEFVRSNVDDFGIRSVIFAPLMGKNGAIGVLALFRQEVRPFESNQVELIKSFAAQAAIAIENVRQFRELETRLEREAATKEILQVISQSRDDETPVFDVILERASILCEAPSASLFLGCMDDKTLTFAGNAGINTKIGDALKSATLSMDPNASYSARAILEGKLFQFDDMAESELYKSGSVFVRSNVDDFGIRSVIIAPLIGPSGAVGALALFREEVRPFEPDQIKLIEAFAAQAAIAIENVRQLRELQTRLEREAATKEILQVISQSRDDEQPVFDVILDNAERLCASPQTFLVLKSENTGKLHPVANRGLSVDWLARFKDGLAIDNPLIIARAVNECRHFHIPDLMNDELYKIGNDDRRNAVHQEGIRTLLAVPVMHDGKAIGSICLFRKEVKPFDDAQIALVEAFAAQAAIAIENVRQYRELQTRLEREAATSEILGVISGSRDDEYPVFEAIVGNAARLCKAPHAFLQLRNEANTHLEVAAQNFATSKFLDQLRASPTPVHDNEGSVSIRTMNAATATHYSDVRLLKGTEHYTPQLRYAIESEGMRTLLVVPLITDNDPVGVIMLYKHEVAPFTDGEISLVETFAAQAVIAIENVRQFKALETLNEELGERVEEQVGEIERMGRLKRFLPAAVADTVVSQGADKLLSSHRALLGVLFCDIRGFTAFCESAEPEETIEVLQSYHEEMGKLINEYNAGVDHRMGDGIMVLFNDPVPCEDPAGDAVRLAIAMRAKMIELCQKWKRLGHRLGFGVGVSFGYATVGMVGYEGRYDYTASGTAVNLAARLCDRAEDGEILLSPRAFTAVEDDFASEPIGEASLKGIREPVQIFRLLDSPM